MPTQTELIGAIRDAAHPLYDEITGYERFLEIAGDARFVLIGEASHGTHEFYRTRAEITKHLLQKHGFTAVTVEADWPDAYRVNRLVRGLDDDATAAEALSDFRLFPAWIGRFAPLPSDAPRQPLREQVA